MQIIVKSFARAPIRNWIVSTSINRCTFGNTISIANTERAAHNWPIPMCMHIAYALHFSVSSQLRSQFILQLTAWLVNQFEGNIMIKNLAMDNSMDLLHISTYYDWCFPTGFQLIKLALFFLCLPFSLNPFYFVLFFPDVINKWIGHFLEFTNAIANSRIGNKIKKNYKYTFKVPQLG